MTLAVTTSGPLTMGGVHVQDGGHLWPDGKPQLWQYCRVLWVTRPDLRVYGCWLNYN